MPKAIGADVLMQFAVIEATWPGVTTVLSEGKLKTGLSIRGGIAWLIHMIEHFGHGPGINNSPMDAVLSSQEGRGAIPTPSDKGTIAQFRTTIMLLTSGYSHVQFPQSVHFLPPIPYAGPNLSLYLQTGSDDANLDGKTVYVRMGFTTQGVEAAMFAELAEVWEQA